MTDFLQLFISGLATGAIYGLAALGFTLLWQASGTINFAQGEFVMLPAFMMLAFMSLGAPLVVSFVFSVVLAVVILGWVFKRGIVDPLFKYGMMPIVVATIGLSIAMRNGLRAGYSAEAHPFPSLFADKLFNIAGVTVTLSDIGTFVLALLLVFATQAFMTKTVTGRAMQAVAQNTESASVLGINVPRMVTLTYGFGVALAALAGVMAAPIYQVNPLMGADIIIVVFAVVVVGGMGSIMGAIVTGFGLGLIEGLTKVFYPEASNTVIFVIMTIVLLLKPAGLFGTQK